MSEVRSLSRVPVMVAPMAGGTSTPELVVAALGAGAFAWLAAGYKTASAMTAEIEQVRAASTAPFGVNVFVPGNPTDDPSRLEQYLREIAGDARRVGAELGDARWDDDDWGAKIDALLEHRPAAVSFTFGCPPAEVVAALRARGVLVAATVTDLHEARIATAVGVDALCAQGIEAGAHRGTFVNDPATTGAELSTRELVAALTRGTDAPVIAAGGIMHAHDVRSMLDAGAVAVQCGTAFLRSDESGAHPTHKAALADPRFTETALTRAFSGRPARGLVNAFLRDHAGAPAAYPEINNATRAMRGAAASAGDPDRMSLWAGQGWRESTAGPAAEIVERLARGAG